jgi:hypothetical protein
MPRGQSYAPRRRHHPKCAATWLNSRIRVCGIAGLTLAQLDSLVSGTKQFLLEGTPRSPPELRGPGGFLLARPPKIVVTSRLLRNCRQVLVQANQPWLSAAEHADELCVSTLRHRPQHDIDDKVIALAPAANRCRLPSTPVAVAQPKWGGSRMILQARCSTHRACSPSPSRRAPHCRIPVAQFAPGRACRRRHFRCRISPFGDDG